jgi:hypothetical protein
MLPELDLSRLVVPVDADVCLDEPGDADVCESAGGSLSQRVPAARKGEQPVDTSGV